MIKRLTSPRQMKFFCFLCCFVYFMSYLTRLNYAACMVEIQRALGLGKDIAGLPVTVCFLSYGTGQLICGFLGDKYSPYKMIQAGMIGTVVCNLLVVFFARIDVIILLWCINGFFQSMLWPPLVRLMAEALTEKWYKHCCVLVTLSSSAATIVIYVLSPVCIGLMGWKSVFALPAVLCFFSAFLWAGGIRKLWPIGQKEEISKIKETEEKENTQFILLFRDAPLVLILAVIILQGTLRDGITTWMPVYMTEVFGMSSSRSILVTSALPVFSMFSTLAASLLFYRLKNEIFTSAVLFGAGAFACIAMLPAYDSFPMLCIAMMTLVVGCMYGVNLMLISHVPGHFAGYGKVSSISGILNAAIYIGSSVSTYGFGAVAENAGWRCVVIIWIAAALAGMIFLLWGKGRWQRFCRNNDVKFRCERI